MGQTLFRFLWHWFWLCLVVHGVVAAQPATVYRCGNAYTNQPDPALHCKPLSSGNVTVIEGTRVSGASAEGVSASASASASVTAPNKVDTTEQRQRDAQAQVVLQSELQKAQKQQADLWREWNNGEPERRADEFRQPQKYQARVTQLRAALERAQADVAGLQRELSRHNPTGAKP
jgi:hypothetical protein